MLIHSRFMSVFGNQGRDLMALAQRARCRITLRAFSKDETEIVLEGSLKDISYAERNIRRQIVEASEKRRRF